MNFLVFVISLNLIGKLCGKFNDSYQGSVNSTSWQREKTSNPDSASVWFNNENSSLDNHGILGSLDKTPIANAFKVMFSKTLQELPIIPSEQNTTALSGCVRDLKMLQTSFESGETWSIPFVDSSGKPGPAIRKTWLYWVGNYDQCNEAVAPASVWNTSSGFRGQYCTLYFIEGKNVAGYEAQLGLCFPDTCSEQDIKAMADQLLQRHRLNATVTLAECRTGHTEVTAATVWCIVVLSCIGSLMVAGTIYDVFVIRKCLSVKEGHLEEESSKQTDLVSIGCQTSMRNHQGVSGEHLDNFSATNPVNNHGMGQVLKVLIAFSMYSNGKKILTATMSKESIGSINGMRYLSIAWVLFGHTFQSQEFNINAMTSLRKYVNYWRYLPLSNSFLAVDTFFVLSGLLTSYLTLKEMDKKGWRINWAMYYFHRFWRLTPPYMLVLLTSLGLTQYLGGGALWANQQPWDKEHCESNWWKNLLYINNMIGLENTCMTHSWYLANDMQFFIISPLMIIAFYFHSLAGVASCLFFLSATWTVTGVLSTINNWTATHITEQLTFEERIDWERDYYIKPWCRIGPYIVGILAGYILTRIKGKSIKVKFWVVALGWLISSATALLVLFGLHGEISGQHPSSTGVAALYNSVARSAWGVSISWIILACDAGYGGPVNAILSWSPFVVLGRLNYMIYLLHPYIINIYFHNLEMPFYANDTTLSLYFMSFLALTSFLAFFFILAFESPMIGLEKVLLRKAQS